MADKNVQIELSTYLKDKRTEELPCVQSTSPRTRIAKDTLESLSDPAGAFSTVTEEIKKTRKEGNLFKAMLETERSELILSILTASGEMSARRSRVGLLANAFNMGVSALSFSIPERIVKVGDEEAK